MKAAKKPIIDITIILIITAIMFGSLYFIMTDRKNGYVFLKQKDGTYCVTAYTGNKTDIEIPSKFKGKPVTSINVNIFEEPQKIKSIFVPNSIEEIWPGAFNGCTSIESITLPFIGRTRERPANLSYLFTKQDLEATQYVPNSLKKVYISNGCKSINSIAFRFCDKIEEVYIPKSVDIIETIPENMLYKPFYGCNPNLVIYCEITIRPENWSEEWNCISETERAKVIWGYK